MAVELNGTYQGTVTEAQPWGIYIRLSDGSEVVVDNDKVGGTPPATGDVVNVTIVDIVRIPPRGAL